MQKHIILSMALVPESTKSYSIFLEIAIDTLNKSLERQRNVNLSDSQQTLISHSFEFLKNSLEIFSVLGFYSPVAQEMHETFVYHQP